MYNVAKRIIDILISFTVLFTLSPLLLILVILLKISGDHEVIYSQIRIGYRNEKFKLYKFVTIRRSKLKIPKMEFSIDNYSRITPIGKILRFTKLNELAQLINVLIGDMSIVGPRPLIPASFEMYSDEIKSVINSTKPGLTGVGSIIFRNEEKLILGVGANLKEYYKEEILPYKGALEIWYDAHKSMKIDTLIVVLTALAILFPRQELHHKILKNLPAKREQKLSRIQSDLFINQ